MIDKCSCVFYLFVFVSSEGALYVMMTYYRFARPLFENTPVLNNNFEHRCHDDFGDYDYYDDQDDY